jgi:predicted  nucleic acid-binding Zn-ribbon protein
MKVIHQLYELQEIERGPKAASAEAKQTAETLRKEIPEPILTHYDRLWVRGKKGVALVRHGVCTGCQMRLASGANAELLRDNDVCLCDSCGRYLMLAPGEEHGPGPVPSRQPKPRKPRP